MNCGQDHREWRSRSPEPPLPKNTRGVKKTSAGDFTCGRDDRGRGKFGYILGCCVAMSEEPRRRAGPTQHARRAAAELDGMRFEGAFGRSLSRERRVGRPPSIPPPASARSPPPLWARRGGRSRRRPRGDRHLGEDGDAARCDAGRARARRALQMPCLERFGAHPGSVSSPPFPHQAHHYPSQHPPHPPNWPPRG